MRKQITMLLVTALTFAMMTCAASAENAAKSDVSAEGTETVSDLGEAYRSVLLSTDFGDAVTYVIGHMHPDTDTVTSAIAYANLLREIGVDARAAVSGPLNNETAFCLDAFGVETPEIVEDAQGKQFVLVDHSEYTHAIPHMENARVVGILDHHGIGDVSNTEMISVRSAPIGSTAALVYLTYRECEVPVSREMAEVILSGILSDTKNLTSNVTEMDKLAYEDLSEIAAIDDLDGFYAQMQEAAASYEGMTELEIFQGDYKEYEVAGVTFAISDIKAKGEEAVLEMADRMRDAMEEHYEEIGLQMLFAKINNTSENEGETRCCIVACGEGAEELLELCFHNSDGEGHFLFDESKSRKKDIVPVLTEMLEEQEMDAAA